jgi:hypothetical protein
LQSALIAKWFEKLILRARSARKINFSTLVSKAGAPARKPKETKVSLTKGFDLCRTFCFLEVRRWLNFAVWAARGAVQTAKNRSARGTIFRTCRVHVFQTGSIADGDYN